MDPISPNYLDFNAVSDKRPILVVEIDGAPDFLSSSPVYTLVRYGAPGVDYGDPGLVYGGLVKRSGVKDYLSLEGSSFAITQTIEPERGKGSISQMTLNFVDVDQYMTNLVSPGVVLPEILGREVRVWLGYQEVSFKEDYFPIFRGFVGSVSAGSGRVTIQLSDPGMKKKQQTIFCAKSKLSISVLAADTTIPVVNAAEFFQEILGPTLSYDTAIKTYLQIEDEFIQYTTPGISGNSFTGVTRGARGTVAADHAAGTEVSAYIEIEDFGIDMALKHMLSGWNGYWKTGVPIISLKDTLDLTLGMIDGAIVLPAEKDAKRDYGLTEGDFVTVSGSGIGGNNVTLKTIVRFIDKNGYSNNIIVLDNVFTAETPSAATLSFRSKYDVWPIACGLRLTPNDVDVEKHETVKSSLS